jgi:hypothetical protein
MPASVPPAEAQQPATYALVRVAYYLNDREQDFQTRCRLYLIVDGAVVPPALAAGYMVWYRKPAVPPPTETQRIWLKCDSYVLDTDLAHYDAFGNSLALVVDAHTDFDALLKEDRSYRPERWVADHHARLESGHDMGREWAQRRYRELPPSVRTQVKAAFSLYVGDGSEKRLVWGEAGFR